MVRTGILVVVPGQDRLVHEKAVAGVIGLLRRQLAGCVILRESVIPDQRHLVEEVLRRWCDEEELDLVVTVGGTFPAPGPGPSQWVPEATTAVVERTLPGLPEAMRAWAAADDPLALLDRSTAGIRGRTLVLNLPEGPQRAVHFLEAVVDVLPQVLARLAPKAPSAPLERATSTDEELPTPPRRPTRRGLDAQEFAAYLRRRRTDPDTT